MSHLRISALLTAIAAVYFTAASPNGQSLGSPVQSDVQAFVQARLSPLSSLTKFSFGVYSDIHMIESSDWGLTRAQWAGLLRQWRDAGDSFGIIVGDLGYGNATDIPNVQSGPAAVPDAPPVLYQMGNHEMDGIGKRAWIDGLLPGAVRPGSWTVLSGVPAGNADPLYYAFDVGPSTHFIVLDGDYMTTDGINARIRQRFGEVQMAWLANEIRANPSKNLMIFIHEPIDQQVTGSTPEFTLNDKAGLLDLLSTHPKQVVIFSGHFHGLRGVTRWKNVTSVHVMANTIPFYGASPIYGVNVTVDGEAITIANAGTVTNFDAHPMNQITTVGASKVIQVAEDGSNSGTARNAPMTVVGAEAGVFPTSGSLMLKGPAMTWYAPEFISEQLIKIQPGMKFSYDIYLTGVVGGQDAVAVQPSWYMKNGSLPPKVVDQNNIQLSQRPRDGMYFLYNEDVGNLKGFATNQWYHREFDLSALAGNYIDGLYLTSGAGRVNVSGVYVDNIRFTWPAAATNTPPTVSLTAPANGASFTAPANITLTAAAFDSDGTVSSVSFSAGSTLLGTSTSAPYTVAWTNVPAGTYSFTAVATDNAGASTTSPPVSVSVTALSPPPSGSATSVFLGSDTTTRGNWKGMYGADGYMLANDATSLPSYATVSQTGTQPYTWASSTIDSRALLKAASATDRIAATYYGSSLDADIRLTDGKTHRVSMYLLDWDVAGRVVTVDSVDSLSGVVLNTQTVSNFSTGRYLSWTLGGRVILRVKVVGGSNGVYSAIFFDTPGSGSPPPTPPPVTGTSAVFKSADTTTRGAWKGVYGTGGYVIANDGSSVPTYVVLKQNGVPAWSWSSTSSDVRALQKAASSTDRIASTWYASTMDIDVDVKDGLSHDLSMYVLDWDSRGRIEAIQVLDALSGAVLDSRSVSAFSNGQYVTWTISGHVILRVTLNGGPNAVYSGLFFDR